MVVNIFGNLDFDYNDGHNILKIFDTIPIFFPPQVKRSVIVSSKHGVYELPQELPNDLRLIKYQKNLKTS